MSLQVRPPDETLIQLSDGDWILVKKWLNAGETQNVMARMVKSFKEGDALPDGTSKADVEYDIGQMGGMSKAVEYLLDWSAKDPSGKPVVIRDKPRTVVESALKALPAEAFKEVSDAVTAHEKQMDAELEALKNAPAGTKELPATSVSAEP